MYLEKVDNVDIDDYEGLVDEVDDAVADGDVRLDHLGYNHPPGVVEIPHQGVGLDVNCV